MDHLHTLNDSTPKIRCRGRDGVDPDIIFGLESKLFLDVDHHDEAHHEEVETITIHDELSNLDKSSQRVGLTRRMVEQALGLLSKDVVWRVKGFLRHVEDETQKSNVYVVNWAFGRYEMTPLDAGPSNQEIIKLTVMGERGEVKNASRRFAEELGGALQL